MIDTFGYTGEDFNSVFQSEGWKIGILRYSERFSNFKVLERHRLTDEVFVLLEGSATLFVENESGVISSYEMVNNRVYNVRRYVWHHIVVSYGTTVLVVENSNTSKDNTEKKPHLH